MGTRRCRSSFCYPGPERPHRAEAAATCSALPRLIEDFLADLSQANHSAHTLRAYAADLRRFAAFHPGSAKEINADTLLAFWASLADLSPATRARKQASLGRFLSWAYRHDLVPANPMEKVDRVQREPPLPRGVGREKVEAILSAIPAEQKRDRLLFRLVFETRLRIIVGSGLPEVRTQAQQFLSPEECFASPSAATMALMFGNRPRTSR